MSENPKLQSVNIGTSQPKPPMPIGPGGAARAGMKLVEKPKNFLATMKKLISYLRPFWISIIFVFVFAIVSTVFAIVSPKILGNMTNQIVSNLITIKSINFSNLQNFVIELLILYIISAIFS
jgi:ATP-binding cassette subfamily B protein